MNSLYILIYRKPKNDMTRNECEHNTYYMLALIDCPYHQKAYYNLGWVRVTAVYLYFQQFSDTQVHVYQL